MKTLSLELVNIFKSYLGINYKTEYDLKTKSLSEDMTLMQLLFSRLIKNNDNITVVPICVKNGNTAPIYYEVFRQPKIRINPDEFQVGLQVIECMGKLLEHIQDLKYVKPKRDYKVSELDDFITLREFSFDNYNIDICEYIDCYCPEYLRDDTDVEYVTQYITEYITDKEFKKEVK